MELCDYIILLCKLPHLTYNIIIWIALNTLAQAFINAWCFLLVLIPELNTDIRNWSQDMRVLKGGNLESMDPPIIRTEINGGPPILIHVFN